MKNKGFTLIELLAVIIILSIIAMIAIPTVTSIIKECKKNSVVLSANNYIKEVNNYLFLNNSIDDNSYDIDYFNIKKDKKRPNSGNVVIKNEHVIFYKLIYDDYVIISKNDKAVVYEKNQIDNDGVLSSKGLSVFDSNIKASGKLKVETEVLIPNSTSKAAIFGGRNNNVTNTFTLFFNTGEVRFRSDYDISVGSQIRYSVKDSYSKIIKNKYRLIIDKYNVDSTTNGNENFISTCNVYLFGLNTNNTVDAISPDGTKAKYFKIYENDILFKYLIPVKKGSTLYKDNGPTEDCFYDIVSKEYLYPKINNSFIYETIS